MGGSVLDPHQVIIVGEIYCLATIENLVVNILWLDQDPPIVPRLMTPIRLLTVADPIETAMVLTGCLLPHPVVVGDCRKKDVHDDLLPRHLLGLGLQVGRSQAQVGHYLPLPTGQVQSPGVAGLRVGDTAVEGAAEEEDEAGFEAGATHLHAVSGAGWGAWQGGVEDPAGRQKLSLSLALGLRSSLAPVVVKSNKSIAGFTGAK